MDTVQSYLKENPVNVKGLTGIMDPKVINRTYNEMHRNAYRSGGFVSPTIGVTVEDEDVDLPTSEYMENLNDEVYSTQGPSAFDTETSNYNQSRFKYIAGQTPLAHSVQRDSLNRRMIGYGFNLDTSENFALAAGVLNMKPEDLDDIRNGDVAITTGQARALYEAQVKQADELISERTEGAPLRANQRMVLTAMAIHNPSLIGPNLTKAIKNGDADGAINEIRNHSNASNSRELKIRRVQDAQHFSNYMPENKVADEELGVRMGIRPKARPTPAAPESVYAEGEITTNPLVPGTTKILDEILAQTPTKQGYIPPTIGATELNTPAVRNGLAADVGGAPTEEQGLQTSLRPQLRPTYALENSLRPQLRPTSALRTSLRPQLRPVSQGEVAVRKDEAIAVSTASVIPAGKLEELLESGQQIARDAFGGMAATAWAGYNSVAQKVIELAGGDTSASVHYYTSEAYRKAVEAGQVEPGTDVLIGEDRGDGENDFAAFTHIEGDNAPAIAAEETPEFFEALSQRPGLRRGDDNNASLVEDGILANAVETMSQLGGDIQSSVQEIAESLVSKTSEVSDAALGKAAGVFESFKETMGDISFREYTSFIGNFVNPGRTITEDNLSSGEIDAMRDLITDARSQGKSAVDYTDMGSSEAESIDSPGLFGGIANPLVRVQRVVGGFQFSKNDKGETLVKNTYNFNGNPKKNKSRVQFYEAYKKGDFETMANIAYRLRTRPISFASVLGYVRQEELKAENKPHESEMIINLGIIG